MTLALPARRSFARFANSSATAPTSEPGSPTWPSLISVWAAALVAINAPATNDGIKVRRLKMIMFPPVGVPSGPYGCVLGDPVLLGRGGKPGGISGEGRHGGLDPAGSVRDAARLEADLDAGERSGDHEVVKIAEVADAEHRVGERPEAVAERHVAALEDLGPQPVGRMPFRQPHRGERGRIFAWIAALDLEAPMPHRPPCRLGGAIMAGEDVVESLLVQHPERDLEALQQVGRRRIREIALFIRGDHLVPGPNQSRQRRLLLCRERLVGD